MPYSQEDKTRQGDQKEFQLESLFLKSCVSSNVVQKTDSATPKKEKNIRWTILLIIDWWGNCDTCLSNCSTTIPLRSNDFERERLPRFRRKGASDDVGQRKDGHHDGHEGGGGHPVQLVEQLQIGLVLKHETLNTRSGWWSWCSWWSNTRSG